MKKHIIYLALVLFATAASTGQKIDSRLYDENQDLIHALIEISDNSTYSVDNSMDKEEKGQVVFEALYHNRMESQTGITEEILRMDIEFQSFYIVNVIKVKATILQLEQLAQRDEVVRIIPDSPMPMQDYYEERATLSTREAEPEWGIKMIQADSVWALGFKGQGVTVGGQDTGYDWDVSPLQKKYRGYDAEGETDHNYNWHDAITEVNPLNSDSLNPCGFDINIPCDDNNHGTHTMGTMVGQDDDNSIGVAPDASWIGCRNMDRGWGRPSTYINCFEWFLAPLDSLDMNPRPDLAPHVITNSWSCPEQEGCDSTNWHIMEEAVINLKNAGIVVVVSAGNSGPDCATINTPAPIFEPSFTIGATAQNDTIARFSSRGLVEIDGSFRLKPNVSAPGRNVRSVIRGGEFRNFSGTSMSGPHVTGLVALMISANPDLAGQVDMIEDIIEASSIPKTTDQECGGVSGDVVPNPVYGYGRVNALKAVEMALLVSSTDEVESSDAMRIVPNPANDYIDIKIKNASEDGRIIIYNELGQLVKNDKYSDHKILFVGGLNVGVYTVVVQLADRQLTSRFVKL